MAHKQILSSPCVGADFSSDLKADRRATVQVPTAVAESDSPARFPKGKKCTTRRAVGATAKGNNTPSSKHRFGHAAPVKSVRQGNLSATPSNNVQPTTDEALKPGVSRNSLNHAKRDFKRRGYAQDTEERRIQRSTIGAANSGVVYTRDQIMNFNDWVFDNKEHLVPMVCVHCMKVSVCLCDCRTPNVGQVNAVSAVTSEPLCPVTKRDRCGGAYNEHLDCIAPGVYSGEPTFTDDCDADCGTSDKASAPSLSRWATRHSLLDEDDCAPTAEPSPPPPPQPEIYVSPPPVNVPCIDNIKLPGDRAMSRDIVRLPGDPGYDRNSKTPSYHVPGISKDINTTGSSVVLRDGEVRDTQDSVGSNGIEEVIVRKPIFYNRLIGKKESRFDPKVPINHHLGAIADHKHTCARHKHVVVPDSWIIQDLYIFIRLNAHTKYANRDLALEHAHKLALKWLDKETTRDGEREIRYVKDIATMNRVHTTVQKAVDQQDSKFLYAEENQNTTRYNRGWRPWAKSRTGFSE